MGTSADVLRIAAGEIGYDRYKDPQTGTKYGRWYANLVQDKQFAANGVAFCAMGASWTLNQANVSCAGFPGAYCPSILNIAKKAGKTLANVRDCTGGDVVMFDWDGGVVDHVGFIEKNMGSYVQTIEFNTNNGKVCRRTRNWSTIKAIIRPDYGQASSSKPASTPAATSKPATNSSANTNVNRIAEDGQWGRGTTTRLQIYLGTPVDGVISQQWKVYKSKNPGLFSTTFEWVDNPKKGGSDCIRALQKKIGMKDQDGWIGPDTIKKLQAYLGTKQDGNCSNPSDVVREMQKRLNNGTF